MKILNRLLCTAALFALPFVLSAQSKEDVSPVANWQNLDLKDDGVFGISTEKAYKELLKGKKSSPVIVAIIDGGIDEEHEDLKKIMWVNNKEIPGNGIDDDKNGYVDDINGWNFIGSAKANIHHDNMELIRLINIYQPKYASALNSTPFNEKERKEFQLYQKLVTDYMSRLQSAQMGLQNTMMIKKYLDEITSSMNNQNPTLDDLNDFKPSNDMQSQVIKFIKPEIKKADFKKFYEELLDGIKYYNTQVKYHLNVDFDPRKDSVGDDYSNSNERIYGNNDITGPDAEHGTHVAGIVSAIRTNDIGIKGVAGNVRIMGVRTVPDGDERDKDVANAIRYSVDNGAKILNMSFGKSYAWDKKVVDEAIKYAVSKGVLLVHAAGNDSKNTEKEDNFPTRLFTDSTGVTMGTADAWIEVGATGWKNDEDLVATFSNFGGKTVDVFAPGVKINSTMPGSKYKENDGTSMAAPVVSGLAALIWSHYPKFTALQVKDIIMKSVTLVEQKLKIKEEGDNKRVLLSEISVSGGIVNAYNALLLAEKTNSSANSKSK
jgi:subtilisin family serine protease